MRVAIYARVSTSDRDQDPETQLIVLREFVSAQGFDVHREWVDHAPATDLVHRAAWRELLDEASKRRFDLLLVWRMDRGFRSVLDAATTLERLNDESMSRRQAAAELGIGYATLKRLLDAEGATGTRS